MSPTTVNYGTSTEQEIKADTAVAQNLNGQRGTKKALLDVTGYLTLAVTTLPLVFTVAVFLGTASTGDLGSSISKVLLG